MALADISTARFAALRGWLIEQDIDPSTVPIDTVLVFTPSDDGTTCTLRYDAYIRENGMIKADPRTGEPIREQRIHQITGPIPEFPA